MAVALRVRTGASAEFGHPIIESDFMFKQMGLPPGQHHSNLLQKRGLYMTRDSVNGLSHFFGTAV